MIAVFPKVEEFFARRSKKRLLIFYFCMLALFVSAEIFMIVYSIIRVNSYQDRSLILPFTLISSALGVGFGWFSLTFFAIKYRLTKNYVNMFDGFKSGLKEAENCTFIEYDDQIKAKDGVEFYVMRVKAKAKNRLYEDVDREILIYKESPKLDIKQGQKLKIITHSSILVAFEIVGE